MSGNKNNMTYTKAFGYAILTVLAGYGAMMLMFNLLVTINK